MSEHVVVTFLVLVAAISQVQADEIAARPADVEFFENRIRPLLAKHCYQCHGSKKQEAGLRLDSAAEIRRGGDSGLLVRGTDPNQSLLVKAVAYGDPELQMPPDGKLTAVEIEQIETWVRRGLPLPDSHHSRAASSARQAFQITDEDRAFRSFRPVSDPDVPRVDVDTWSLSPVDRFVARRRDDAGLPAADPAERAVLLRRVTFDLTGVPPEADALSAFVRDESPDAYERHVDRLLASPHLGERQARHWLDVVRYSETAGHVQDMERPHCWRYRDYVIESMNDDLPYDRFITEHIAGDLLPERRSNQRGDGNVAPIATGFLWFHEMHFKPVDPLVQRADQVDAQIDIVGKAFLGLTLACARCHDHKFDPVSQRDYYALAGFFDSTQLTYARTAVVQDVSESGRRRRIEEIRREIDKVVDAGMKTARSDATAKRAETVPLTEDNFSPNQRKKLDQLRDELATLNASTARWARGAVDRNPHDSRLHVRGNPRNPGEVVRRRFVSILADQGQGDAENIPVFEGASGRRYLARKIADSQNPLTRRVMVNRMWHHHFGRGLVESVNNFGRNGSAPSHPELLDYLAVRFLESGWSVKRMHRLMVQSATYRQASDASDHVQEHDPRNIRLARMPIRRLEAESIRDAMLAVSGVLDRRQFGKSIPPWISPNATANKPIHIPKSGPLNGNGRRSIYILIRRNFRMPFLETFDFPDPASSVGRRDVTTVPRQALAMMNSPFVHDQAARWGDRMAVVDASTSQRIVSMFVDALSREPAADELETLVEFAGRRGDSPSTWTGIAHILFNSAEFIFIR